MAPEGLTHADLLHAQTVFESKCIDTEIFNLREEAGLTLDEAEDAYFLMAHKGITALLPPDSTMSDIWDEQSKLDWDKKVWMRGRVVNKKARHNLCYSDDAQEPDYENKKGRVIPFDSLPLTKSIRTQLPDYFGPKVENLQGEGNYYYDLAKTGVGAHGDVERKIVIAVRLGSDFPLYYQWYRNSEKIGPLLEMVLEGGDVYAMSAKAVGTDWKKKKVATLRHAAGSKIYTKL